MPSFQDFQLPAQVREAVARIGFKEPTPIQIKAIPVGLAGQDLIGCAQTGTGKTAAFCLPIFSQLLSSQQATALVLVPTRELAKQIEDFWRQLTNNQRGLGCTSLIGGEPMHKQMRSLAKRPRLIVATPGRLIDHLKRRTIDLSRLAVLVLDEADRMLDMGFEPQLAQISRFVPERRQTFLFSATLSQEAERLSAKFVKNPVRVTVGEISKAGDKIDQTAVSTDPSRKNETLLDELNKRSEGTVLIFARTKSRTDRLTRYLAEFGLEVGRIHGGRTQGQRNAALRAFKTGEVRILVATDIASRGIDVQGVSTVINYDLPEAPEDYIHRIGRTGRGGASGEALSLITREDQGTWRDILRLLKKTGSNVPTQSVAAEKSGAPKQVQAVRVEPKKPQRDRSFPSHANKPQGKPEWNHRFQRQPKNAKRERQEFRPMNDSFGSQPQARPERPRREFKRWGKPKSQKPSFSSFR